MEDEMLDTASDSHSQAPILEIGDQPSPEFLELFAKLDPTIGGELIEKAWKQFDTTSQQVVLEGNQNVWMACAFFTSVWQQTPIAQQQQHELACHYSLTRLLELCQVSVLDFFDKLNKWMEMILANRRFQDFVNRVQSNLAVSAVIFKKFLPIYRHVFVNVPQPSPTRAHKSRYANMPQKLTSRAIFDLTWLFYIALRKQLPHNQEDLLSSYHLLICVIDYIYNAMEAAGLQKHLNSSFATSLALNEQTPLERLCEEFDAVTLDAKHLRVHWMLPRLRMLSIEGAIGELEGGIFSAYDNSRQAFEELYEHRMLARSEVDERIFLQQKMADVEGIFNGTLDENAVTVLREFDHSGQRIETDLLMKISTQNCLERLGAQKQPVQQPIVGKSYLITPETVCPNITLNADLGPAARMEQMLTEYREENENILEYIFEECQGNPRDYIAQQLLLFPRKLIAKVDEEMAEFGPDYDAEFEAGIGKHIPNIETLFYYFLQRVVTYDRERALNMGMEMNIDLGAIFQSNEFLASLFICSADLILWANGSQRKFPWVANLFEEIVQPLNFYRIIELIIRADTGLTKQMVKHLNWVEECVLEELAWAQDSKIWKSLQGSHAVDKFGEISPVPGSQILARTYVSTHRHADLAPNVIMFFKKVYHLAAIRLTDLCERIRVMDDLTRQKIWTLFEHIFRMQTTMLKGRHLDQLILCSIYIIVKVSNLNITFQEIMQHYRHQPQAASRVFREVLMESPFDPSSGSSAQATSSNVTPEKEDLIKFYNRIFISRVEDFVKLLHPSGPDTKENLVPLSPMPKVPLNPLSPRKLINERINVVPMSQYAQSVSQSRFGQLPGAGRRYDFHKSPSKDLKNINAMVRGIVSNSAGPSTSTNVEFGGHSTSQYYQSSSNGSIYQ